MTPIDRTVGERIRIRRNLLGMTQTELADQIQVRFQQVQKYENGQNRVAASRLWQIAQALDVQVTYFFESISDSEKQPCAINTNGLDGRKKRELVTLFADLPEPQQTAVMSFLRSLSEAHA